MTATEFDILQVFTDEMDNKGKNRKLIHISIDEEMLEIINQKLQSKLSIDELHRLADKCIASEWLEHVYLGHGKYGMLGITATGFGVARSRLRKQEQLAQRPLLKKASDFIEEHKGLFILLGFLLALASFLVKLFIGSDK